MLIGGIQLVMSVAGVQSALLGVPRSLVYAMGPISGFFIVLIQVINIWEDVTGNVTTDDEAIEVLSEDQGNLEGKV